MYDLIVIGGGPAALAAAFYAQSKQVKMVMIYEELGGKTSWWEHDIVEKAVPRLSLPGNELVQILTRSVSAEAGNVIHDRVVKVQAHDEEFVVQTQTNGTLTSTAVIVATGASPIHLDVPGADGLLGPLPGYSITTYAQLVRDRHVAVIGTTSRALRGAAELAHTAAQVYLIVPDAPLPPTVLIGAIRRRPNIDLLEGYEVKESMTHPTARELVLERQGGSRQIRVEQIFVDLGIVPNSGLVQGVAYLDRDGFIVVDEYNNTTMPGLFAAGDVTTAFAEQVLVAIGDGARAAQSAYDYLLARWLVAKPATITRHIQSP